MPNWASLSSTFLVGHESGILMTCPSHRILPAFSTVRMLGFPHSPAILLLHAICSNTPPKMVRSMRHSHTPRAFASSARMRINMRYISHFVRDRSLLDLSSR
uniref:Uncharacterized protein n=1 Tax=Anopheles gambiae TaxID=7165 RepID=A0A0E4C728_ANOGA